MPIIGYRVYRNGALIGSPSTPTFTDTGLTNGQTYSYQVSAVTEAGEGPKSAVTTATPAATAPPSQNVAQFPGAGPNTAAAFLSLVANMTYDAIEIAGGTYTWDGVHIDVDRSSRPLTVRPRSGEIVTFVGDGATSEGIFFLGYNSYTAYITFDGIIDGGFQFTGMELAAAGIWEVRSSSHVTIAHCRYTNIRRSTTIGDDPQPYKTWMFYISMGSGVRNNADLWIHHQKVDRPTINRNHAFANNGSSTLVNGDIKIGPGIDLTGVTYAFYGDVANTGHTLTLDGWTLNDCGWSGDPSSIRFTAKVINVVYSNIHATSSDPLHNQSLGTVVNGGGNSGI